MSNEARKWLTDIAEAIQNITIHLDGKLDFSVYQANITIRRAVERELEIIGEATNRLLKVDNTIAITNAQRIVDLRNRVIHAYDAVDDAIVWSVVVNRLPALKQEVDQLLADA
jgi:uncharacterized protein with HEPN domain